MQDVTVKIDLYELQDKVRNCNVIQGHLVIAMGTMEDNTAMDPQSLNISFPELREVTDYVMLYQTKHITTLATLFPNLTVIRGNNLFKVKQTTFPFIMFLQNGLFSRILHWLSIGCLTWRRLDYMV